MTTTRKPKPAPPEKEVVHSTINVESDMAMYIYRSKEDGLTIWCSGVPQGEPPTIQQQFDLALCAVSTLAKKLAKEFD